MQINPTAYCTYVSKEKKPQTFHYCDYGSKKKMSLPRQPTLLMTTQKNG
jgi:hypothetical protein